MRSILNISLPQSEKIEIIRRAKMVGKTVSAYILSVVALEQELIGEDELLAIAEKARKDHMKKKTKVLKSLKNLM